MVVELWYPSQTGSGPVGVVVAIAVLGGYTDWMGSFAGGGSGYGWRVGGVVWFLFSFSFFFLFGGEGVGPWIG